MYYLLSHKKLIFVILFLIFTASMIPAVYLWSRWSLIGPKPGSCLILEEKYCKTTVFIPNPHDPEGILAVARIPQETHLFSPVDGLFSVTPTFFFENPQTKQIKKYPGVSIAVSADGTSKTVKDIYSFIYYKKGLNTNSSKIKKGDIIGTVSEKTIDFLGDYNLVIGISRQDLSDDGKAVFTNGNDQLKTLFKTKMTK